MTTLSEDLKQRIRKEAEEKYPLYSREEIESVQKSEVPMYLAANVEARSKRESYISAAEKWASKIEEIRKEVEKHIVEYKRYYKERVPNGLTIGSALDKLEECEQILALIDKHLKPTE